MTFKNETSISRVWLDFYEGRASIQKVLTSYDEHGFDANQDLPGNMRWEEMYDASPKGTKVILTVRESDEKWWKSWCGFMLQARLNFPLHSSNAFVKSGLIRVKLSIKN